MDVQQIKIKLNSEFASEGFEKANSAISSLGQTTAAGAQRFGSLVSGIQSLGGADAGALGQLAQGVGKVAGAFQKFGVAGAVGAAMQYAIGLVGDRFVNAAEQAAEKAKSLEADVSQASQNMADSIANGVVAAVRAVSAEINNSIRSLNSMVSAAQAVDTAMGRKDSASENASVVNLKLEVLNNVISAETADAAALAQAEGNLQVALLERENAISASARAVQSAQSAEDAANQKKALAETALSDATQALADARDAAERLEVPALNDREKYGKQYDDALKAVTDAENLVKTREDALATAISDCTVAHTNMETAQINASAQEDKYTMAVVSAEKALNDLRDSQEAAAQQEAERAAAAQQRENIAAQQEAERAAAAQQRENSAARAQIIRDDAENARAMTRAYYEDRRQQVLEDLRNAEAASAQWERNKVEQQGITYSEIKQRNLQNIERLYDQNVNFVSDAQRQEVEAYKDWLRYQTANPNSVIIENLKMQLSEIDSAEAQDLKDLEKNTKKQLDELQSINNNLMDALKLQ